MLGMMQGLPLLVSMLLDFAERHHGDATIVSRRTEGDIHRYDWVGAARRARQVAAALDRDSVEPGSRIGTLAWNGYRHLELYYGVSGSGRVLHTINPRLHTDQIAWIVNHAGDEALAFDLSFLDVVEAIHAQCPSVRNWIALCDADKLPLDRSITGLVSYETWLADHPDGYAWPVLDENTASSLCYTSGTTGNPKGVLYSHRSSVLHAYAASLPDVMALSARDTVLPVVPMFHVNAWGLPFSAALTGCRLVFAGPALDGKSVYDLIEGEGVTFAAGVPTIWQMLLGHIETNDLAFSTLKRSMIGGSACPPAMIEALQERHGVEVLHAWGMTETSPLGAVSALKHHHLGLSRSEQNAIRSKQGRALCGVDIKVVGQDGEDKPWDGVSFGDLLIRGPWVARDYFRSKGDSPLIVDKQGLKWFPTGDVAAISADGFMQITDRSKDVIKSGGEWISSIDLENIAMAHPAVAMVACVGVPHPKWDERPVIVVVRKAGAAVSCEELLAFYEGKIAKWQIPDDVIFVEELPVGGTGKILKADVRRQLHSYRSD